MVARRSSRAKAAPVGKSARATSRILAAGGTPISPQGLNKAIASGRVTREPDGTLNPKKVKRQLRANTHPGRGRGGGAQNGNGAHAAAGYQTARTFRETFKARIEQLEYKRLLGELVDVSEVRRIVFSRARKARDLMLSIPARLAPVVAGMDDPKACLKVIEDEINRVVDELADESRDRF